MTPSVLDSVWKLIDPILAQIGISKTELVGILAIVVAAMTMMGKITSEQATEWLTVLAGLGTLTMRAGIRKAEQRGRSS